jgi:hypothetical protein
VRADGQFISPCTEADTHPPKIAVITFSLVVVNIAFISALCIVQPYYLNLAGWLGYARDDQCMWALPLSAFVLICHNSERVIVHYEEIQ